MPVKHQMTVWVVVLAAALSYGIVFLILSQQSTPQSNIVENQAPQALPAVRFYDAKGAAATLADFKGQPMVINLWATWCPPCVGELPSLDRLQAKMKSKGLKVIAISMDKGDNMDAVTKFLQKRRIEHFAPYWDKDRQVMEAFEVENLPVSFLVSRDGKIVKRLEGPAVWDKGDALKSVQELLK